jgi:hypothetical protein
MPIRVNYFDRQFLKVDEFKDEQNYHLGARRRLTGAFQDWGIVQGLEVLAAEPGFLTVSAGMAVDSTGREIVFGTDAPAPYAVPEVDANKSVFVTIAYAEALDEKSKSDALGAPQQETRMIESAKVTLSADEPPGDGSVVVLGRFVPDGAAPPPRPGNVLGGGVRRYAGARRLAGFVSMGFDKVDNSESWNRVFEIEGAGNARITLRSHPDPKVAIDGRIQVHDKGWWGSAPGMIVGTKTGHDLSFGVAGVVKMNLNPYDGVVVSAPFNVRGPNLATFANDVWVTGGVKAASVEAKGKITSPMWKVTQVKLASRTPPYPPNSLPMTGDLETKGGTLLAFMQGSGYSGFPVRTIGMELLIGGRSCGTASIHVNKGLEHCHLAFAGSTAVLSDLPAGAYKVELRALGPDTRTDENDRISVTVLELPF